MAPSGIGSVKIPTAAFARNKRPNAKLAIVSLRRLAIVIARIAAPVIVCESPLEIREEIGQRYSNRDFPDGFHTGDNEVWRTQLYRPETASSTSFYVVGLILGYVPHAKSLSNGSHRAPVSQIESLFSELAYVLLRHPGFSAGRVVLSRAILCRISRNSWRGIATSAIWNIT